ncbi:DUF5686 family protein [Lacinutrix neustonica]|uniref:DUF5686 family protein n=1 Tax=Lacinutrix neustonica TaxID=2980107 RepID=A0A9E8MW09_9FLAO|nr:DUF5686 family protein [Lacinutrix neustonica]WAC02086.1 DUF5686 family protein [Lacinutrix neustonica]
MPREKILGQEVGDLGGGLDSTRSGIIYLSETISKLEHQAPNRLKEKIIASKVSGNDNGFSFNNARDVNYNFYENTIDIEGKAVSPIASNAFNYYRYKLDGVFYDDKGNLINKIELTPKRKNDAAFSGYIYIVEDQWNLYAVDVNITGLQVQVPPIDLFTIKQTFSYSETDRLWAKISQTLDFSLAIFGIKANGRFTGVYSDYDFNPKLEAQKVTREILSFQEDSNKKDSIYWETKRPVPLTKEEVIDYVKKDSIQLVKNSQPYLDSVDRANNSFKLGHILGGYSYQNSTKKTRFNITSPISQPSFNTVQGFNGTVELNYRKRYDENYGRRFSANTNLNYGEADDRLRVDGSLRYQFNNKTRPVLSLYGGIKTEQFNPALSDLPLINSFYSLLAEKNFLKIYDKSYAKINYSQELFNGFQLSSELSYERRKALFNNTDQAWSPKADRQYSSNNPLNPVANNTAPFITHNILKLKVGTRINFDQDYLSYPNGKFNIPSSKYPTLYLGYEKGFGATTSDYNFDVFKARLYQSLSLGAKGHFKYLTKAGLFINADEIAFMDFHHFNGNQTNITTDGNYLGRFKNLSYYGLSTNNQYTEVHLEHSFDGYILNKIPLLNKLNFNLVVGANLAATHTNKPYNEFSVGIDNIGWGKLRFLRVDYVRSYQSGFLNDAFMFGFSF